MTALDRRRFLAAATALGASAAWSGGRAAPSQLKWTERRDLFPQGVASGDPQHDSVILWTRRPPTSGEQAQAKLVAEVAEDEAFQRVVASAPAAPSAENGWTVRVLVGGLKPSREYWYRFVDANGAGSRIGRTLTAPAPDDPREVRFAFVSCQDANAGAMNAWVRMLYEDRQAPPDRRLDFVCHLGDFIYEIVWYPEDRPQGRYDRKIRDVARYPNGVKFQDMHYPTTLDDYRAVWLGYLKDPDLQDARAWFPFVNMGDNHEFSWRGYQSIQKFGDQVIWGQTRRVAANQAWFEHQPARVIHKGALNRFDAPDVANTPVAAFDDQGLGQEPNNLAAIGSLTSYRALRFGKNVELFLTDQHAYRTEDPNDRPEVNPLGPPLAAFPEFQPQELTEMLDAGRAYDGGKPPAEIRFGDKAIPNFRKDQAPVTMLGATQKAWFLKTLKASKATWKIWGATNGTLELRCDYQNLPTGLTKPWPGAGYADGGGGDWSGCYAERGELYDFVRDNKITGFSVISGDRHSFWAGYAAKALPPKAFEPVGVAFITGSISAAGMAEALEHTFPKAHPLRALFLADRPNAKPEHTMNMTMRHGVRSALEYTASRDVLKARALSNPDLSPHLKFVDMAGHGYAIVRAGPAALETEFVAIERPIERNPAPNGGPLEYRVVHRAALWKAGERPHLEQRILEGDPKLSI
ncbi:alkaline phosphatase D family protein [Phenylobacterium sp.]|uniref:alkaline phosphatase D family protein n=1 Tax=Phenylobacterium sp. TaxID=1871053 RepID=UPI002CBA21D4|nr:alkaline phosphatase D family protein [Phenylobacterium sp.]HLZ75216.1 alkaline phosphatase D family protein [Phenylobacterium sp.]